MGKSIGKDGKELFFVLWNTVYAMSKLHIDKSTKELMARVAWGAHQVPLRCGIIKMAVKHLTVISEKTTRRNSSSFNHSIVGSICFC